MKKWIKSLFQKKSTEKIFCISMQRTGTTSVGEFFKHFGYSVSDWFDGEDNQWSEKWLEGNFEAIFNSRNFKNKTVFEDSPFWFPEFYKVLYHRFPDAKFILFIRNTDDWFRSLLHFAKGKIWDDFKLHCKLYRREKYYYQKVDANNTEEEYFLEHAKHYKEYYETRNREVIDFFNANNPSRLIICDLNDTEKWQKAGKFFGIEVPNDFEIHAHKSGKGKRVLVEELLSNKEKLKNE